MNAAWLRPAWNIPGLGAVMTTRDGGVGQGPWRSMNVGAVNGGVAAHVTANRASLAAAIGAEPVYLRQVHGVRAVELTGEAAIERAAATQVGESPLQADAAFTTRPGIACTVLAADCLPVLFAAPRAAGVAASHAGWRGLSAGVLEGTLHGLCQAAGCDPAEIDVWLGACIGPHHFQVGADVLHAFGRVAADARFEPDGHGRWLADLPGLARDRLQAAGVRRIHGGSWCTVADPARFFSYRRDRVTGRMAACIWIER